MTYEIFLMRVMHRTGLEDRALAEELTHYVVQQVAHCMPGAGIEAVTEALPPAIADSMQDHAGTGVCDLDTLYNGVSERLDVDLSFGLEFTQVVCQVLGETVGPAGRQSLRTWLPETWHPLFEPRQTTTSPLGRRRDDRRTLSSAQPGSARPLSEAQPGHRNSIALTEQPQFTTKISTSHGKASRRTLAGGRPGSSRSISGN